MADLFRRIQAEQAQLPAADKPSPPQADLAQILAAADQVRAAHDQQAGNGGQGEADRGGQAAAQSQSGRPAAAHAGRGSGRDASSGDLFGQVKPCWDALPAVATVPVTLQVTLDAAGRIAKPPRIDRPAGAALDERRLVSEARALAAITACVPYHDADALGGKRVFEVKLGG
jgi:hypothetical protein